MGKVFDAMTTAERQEHFKKALGAKRDFESWFATMKVWLAQTEGKMPYASVPMVDVLSAYTAAAQLGLLIDGNECMVMIRGRKDPKIKCEIGAAGVVRKAGQAGIMVNARTIKQGDDIEIDEGTGSVKHKPAWLRGEKEGPTLGYYAVATYRDGRTVVRSLSLGEAQRRSTETGAWKTWPDQMGEKSAILVLRKVLYFGDEIEDLIAKTGAEVGDSWAAGEENEPEPVHPPKALRDKVLAAAARKAQDDAAEQAQREVDDEFVEGTKGSPSEEQELPL